MLDATEEALDEISVFVLMAIEGTLNHSMDARGNHRVNAVRGQISQDGLGVVSLVSAERSGLQAVEQRQRLGAVAGLATGKGESSQDAQALDEGVNFGAQPATGSSERLFALFFGAPAAC